MTRILYLRPAALRSQRVSATLTQFGAFNLPISLALTIGAQVRRVARQADRELHQSPSFRATRIP
jgi:triphosphoribosyl-dephospho-CoA synthetase